MINLKNYKDEDLIGLKFGKLTVVEIFSKYQKGAKRIFCKVLCDCCKIKEIYKTSITRGKTKSCGCINKGKKISSIGDKKISLWNRYLKQSSFRGLIVELSFEEFINLSQSNCYYCGCLPLHALKSSKGCTEEWREKTKLLYNGIDRKNNNYGYVFNNCVPCCGQCNRMKLNYTYESFMERIEKIYNNHIKNK